MQVFTCRWDFLRPLVEGKDVLDIGATELVGTVSKGKRDRWIHGRMAKVARRLVGVDISEEQVNALRAEGFDMRIGDAESFAIGETFDVIVAGELIEHLSNPGQFLDRARTHLRPGGILALTTPNRYSIHTIIYVLKTGRHLPYEKPIAKHVAFYDSDSLTSLLRRHGFENIDIAYCKWVGAGSRAPVRRAFVDAVARVRPAMLSTIVATASVADAPAGGGSSA